MSSDSLIPIDKWMKRNQIEAKSYGPLQTCRVQGVATE